MPPPHPSVTTSRELSGSGEPCYPPRPTPGHQSALSHQDEYKQRSGEHPTGAEAFPVSLLQAAELSHCHLHTLALPKMLCELGLLAQAKPGRALCQMPPPAELPELFWAGSAQS